MSQLEYYRQDPRRDLPHRSGLQGWGIGLIVFGSLAALSVCSVVVMFFVMIKGLLPGMSGQNPYALLAGGGANAVAAVLLIWLGIGSIRGRRWVRPVIIAGSILMGVSGLASVASIFGGVVSMAQHPTTMPTAPGLPANFEVITYASTGCFTFVIMEVVPGILIWFYGRASVGATLDLLDPRVRWTDRCPLPVLIWCMACVWHSVALLSIAIAGVFPFFSEVLTGPPARVIIGLLGLAMLAGGYLCYRRHPLGWLVTLAATVIIAASYITFGLRGDHKYYLDLMFENMPKATRDMTERMMPNIWIGPAVTYIIATVYGLWLWKPFKQPVVLPVFPPLNPQD